MDIKELIFDLCSASGVSGEENPALDVAEKYLRGFSEIQRDNNGNLIATLGNIKSEKTILLDAHIDRIGFIVTDIDNKGFVKVNKCGGIDVRTLLDTELIPQKHPEMTGVVCCMPPHLSDGKEDKAIEADKLYVDFGLPYEEVRKSIKFGDCLTFKSKPQMLLNDRIVSSALDNRCGVAAVIKAAEMLCKADIDYKIVVLLSSQEETYGKGAKTGAFSVNPDEAVVVDVSFASQPDISGQYSSIELGKGPMICISPILNRKMSDMLIDLSEKNGIAYQLEPISALTGTNADSITISASGVCTALVSIPQKYMHTPNEVVSVCDVENTARLIYLYVKNGGAFNA